MDRAARVGLVVAAALVAFSGMFFLFRSDGDGGMDVSGESAGCVDGAADGSYRVAVDGEVRAEAESVTVAVTRDGQPVTGATVCIEAAMAGMAGHQFGGVAEETAGGRYRVDGEPGMRGDWVGTVTVEEPGHGVVGVPLTFTAR